MKNAARRIVAFAAVLLMACAVALSMYVADFRARARAVERAGSVLTDSAREQTATFASALDGQFDVLESVAAVMNAAGLTDAAAVEPWMNELHENDNLHFSSLTLYNLAGAPVFPAGAPDAGGSEAFKIAAAGQRGMENVTDAQTGRTGVALYVPCRRDGQIVGALCGLSYEDSLRGLLESQVYGGAGYSYLLCAHGDIIVNAENDVFVLEGGNFFTAVKDAEFPDGLDGFRQALTSGQAVTVRYRLSGVPLMAVAIPLEDDLLPPNDWIVLNVVPEESFAPEVDRTSRDAVEPMYIFAVFAVVAAVMLFLIERAARRAQGRQAEVARQREEQFRIVTEQSGKYVMRYDVPTHAADSADLPDDFGGGRTYLNYAESMIADGRVDARSADDFRAFFARVGEGQSPVSATVLMARADGSRRWFRYDSTTIRDAAGKPKTAIISCYDDTEQRERELAYGKWQQELSGAPDHNAVVYGWNLTQDEPDGQSGVALVDYAGLGLDLFDKRATYFAERYVAQEDRKALLRVLNRETLLARYVGGAYHQSADYRFIGENGDERWRRVSIQLLPYPDKPDIKAYITDRDVGEEKREELQMLARAQQDSLTGALNRETFIERVNETLAAEPDATHTLIMLDVDGFKQINDTLGHGQGDRTLGEFVRRIRISLRSSDFVGRIGGDEFMALLPDMPFDAAIEKKVSRLMAALRWRLDDKLLISASIGIAVYPRDGRAFDELYPKADKALYRAKARGKGKYAFYREDMDDPAAMEVAEAAPPKETVVIATQRDELFADLDALLGDSYALQRAASVQALNARVIRAEEPLAILVDADERFGANSLTFLRDSANRRPIIALTDDAGVAGQTRLLTEGAATIVPKPPDRELLRLRLARLAAARENSRDEMQTAYSRLQSADELRYREVLRATRATVIVYDPETRDYLADLLPVRATEGELDGHDLGDDLLRHNVMQARDVKLLLDDIAEIHKGAKAGASHDVQLQAKDGARRWYRIQIERMKLEGAPTQRLLIIANDVDERVAAERKLLNRAERDALTGLYNRETFLEKAEARVKGGKPGDYVMAYFDINSFKVVNDQYGTARGDRMLRAMADVFRRGFGPMGGLCARLVADNFAILYPARMDEEALARIRTEAARAGGDDMPVTFSIGRYRVDDLSLSASAMLDRATMAESSVKGRFGESVAVYDESMRERILREQEIINDMDAALEKEQFELWFQPIMNHVTGGFIGAEALVRWRHPRKGLIPPGEFIPVFERNGFVYELDKYVWERACQSLRAWLDSGRKPLPLSVNASRYDVLRPDFYDTLTGLVRRYEIPVELLRLEITESAFADSNEQIIRQVKRLIAFGFTIEIDDFGSGYSSLNTLKDVPASILKLDMRFLEGKDNSQRGGNIVESVVRMAKWLDMAVIAEGVETREQADYLSSIGCSYVQGYLYYKPMPREEYEALAPTVAKEKEMPSLRTVDRMDNIAFWDPESMETLIFNSYVGGACIYESRGEAAELLRVNRQYVEILGGGAMTEEDAIRLRLTDYMDESNRDAFYSNIRVALKTDAESSCDLYLRDLPGRPGACYLRMVARPIARAEERALLYCSVTDMTAQRVAEKQLRDTSEQLRAIMDNVNGGMTATVLEEGGLRYIYANDQYFAQLGYTRRQFADEVKDPVLLILPEYRDTVRRLIHESNESFEPYECAYRATRRDGAVVWLQSTVSVTMFQGVKGPVHLTVTSDITALREADEAMVESSRQLRFLNDVSRELLAADGAEGSAERILRLILAHLDADRVRLMELAQDGDAAHVVQEVCAPGVEGIGGRLVATPTERARAWSGLFRDRSHLMDTRLDALENDYDRELFRACGVTSMLTVPLRRDGALIGLMAADNPRSAHANDDYMDALGDYLAVVLTRRDLNLRIRREHEALEALRQSVQDKS